jgi:hypothetical protein
MPPIVSLARTFPLPKAGSLRIFSTEPRFLAPTGLVFVKTVTLPLLGGLTLPWSGHFFAFLIGKAAPTGKNALLFPFRRSAARLTSRLQIYNLEAEQNV